MGFFDRILSRSSRDRPVVRTAGSAWSFLFGATASGKRVDERTAMQTTAVYACVRVLAEAVAGLPLHLYRRRDDGGKEKALDHPLYHLLHDEPNGEMTSFIFRETLMSHLLLWGNAYAQVIRNGRGEVVALHPLLPDRMEVDRDKAGRIVYRYTPSDEARFKGATVALPPAQVLHIPGLGFDGLVFIPVGGDRPDEGLNVGRGYFWTNGLKAGQCLAVTGYFADTPNFGIAFDQGGLLVLAQSGKDGSLLIYKEA